jgi:hypothetical protein
MLAAVSQPLGSLEQAQGTISLTLMPRQVPIERLLHRVREGSLR